MLNSCQDKYYVPITPHSIRAGRQRRQLKVECTVTVITNGGSRMRESCTSGSVRGALSDAHPYRDPYLQWSGRCMRPPVPITARPSMSSGIRL
jgi:hypothetical protein